MFKSFFKSVSRAPASPPTALNRLPSIQRPAKPPATPPKLTTKPATVAISDSARLTAQKLLEFAIHCDNFYNGHHFSEQQRRVYEHDLAVFLAAGDLKSVSYEVLDAMDPSNILWAWDAELPDQRLDSRTLSIATPECKALLAEVGEVRFIVRRLGRESLYADNKLMGNWQNAEAKTRNGGSSREDLNTLRATGGRVSAQSWSSDTNKVDLELFNVDEGGFAFARSRQGVMVHVDRREFKGGGLAWARWRQLRPGAKVRALLVPCRRKKDGAPSITAQAVELIS